MGLITWKPELLAVSFRGSYLALPLDQFPGAGSGPAGKQGIPLAFDKRTILARQPAVLGAAHGVEVLARVPHHVELVEQDGRLRRARPRYWIGCTLIGSPHQAQVCDGRH